ncbi:MAG: zf-HC2 domain-containing protein [Bryobacteraceae bacterium]
MDNLFQNNSGEKSEHPPREMLLLLVDGELQAKDATQLEVHLEACWPCRVKTKKIQEAIADIIEFDEQVLTPRLVPPGGWRNFDRQLSQLVAASGKQSLSSRLFGSLGRFFPAVRFTVVRHSLPPMVRYALASLMLLVAVSLIVYFKHEPTVSASELLNNAINAQSQLIRSTNDPVLHQKFQLRRKNQASTREESVSWEIWNDTKNSRVRHFLNDGSRAIPIVPTSAPTTDLPRQDSANDLVNELAQVLAVNHMDTQRPLSATSYQSWYNTLQRPRDEITRSRLANGLEALTLRTVPTTPLSPGQIADAILVVRAKDWQPTQLRLTVQAQDGNRVYELTEDLSEVMSLAQVDPTIFAAESVASAPTAKTSPSPTSSPAKLNPIPLPLTVEPPQAIATADLEVEALSLLSQVGADLGEQITVERTAEGTLQITGIAETDQRKTEIINALGSIAGNPAVNIKIQSVTEAVADQRQPKATPSPSVREVEITGNTIAAEPDLRTYFGGKTEDTDQAIRQYAARMVSLSGRAMDHLWAMKRLLNQFSPEEIRALSPEARDKWISLIRSHARSFQQTSQLLRRELQPVFFPGQSLGAAAEETTITDINKLAGLVNQLFELGSTNDRVVRSAFTSSTGAVMTTAIKTPQFWQSLRNAEGLAARIGRAQ